MYLRNPQPEDIEDAPYLARLIERLFTRLSKETLMEPDQEERLTPDIIVQFRPLSDDVLAIEVYQQGGDTRQFIGGMECRLLATPTTMGVQWSDGTRLALWKVLQGDSSDTNDVVCGINGCTFAVERGEGRAMVYHRGDAHGAKEA